MSFSKGTAIYIYQLCVCIVLTCAILAMYWPCYESGVRNRVMEKAASRNRLRSRQGPVAKNRGRGKEGGTFRNIGNTGWSVLAAEHCLLASNLKFRQRKLLILKGNSYFNVNKRLSTTRWTTLYSQEQQ